MNLPNRLTVPSWNIATSPIRKSNERDLSKDDSKEEEEVWYDLNKEINDLDDTQDLVSKEESEIRLNGLCTLTSMAFLGLATAFVAISARIAQPALQIEITHSVQKTRMVSGVPHILLVTPGGHLLPINTSAQPPTESKSILHTAQE